MHSFETKLDVYIIRVNNDWFVYKNLKQLSVQTGISYNTVKKYMKDNKEITFKSNEKEIFIVKSTLNHTSYVKNRNFL